LAAIRQTSEEEFFVVNPSIHNQPNVFPGFNVVVNMKTARHVDGNVRIDMVKNLPKNVQPFRSGQPWGNNFKRITMTSPTASVCVNGRVRFDFPHVSIVPGFVSVKGR
jgi:hypothetical protein